MSPISVKNTANALKRHKTTSIFLIDSWGNCCQKVTKTSALQLKKKRASIKKCLKLFFITLVGVADGDRENSMPFCFYFGKLFEFDANNYWWRGGGEVTSDKKRESMHCGIEIQYLSPFLRLGRSSCKVMRIYEILVAWCLLCRRTCFSVFEKHFN